MGFTKKDKDTKERAAFADKADASKEVVAILEKFTSDDDKLDVIRMAGLIIPPKPSPYAGIFG